MSYESAPATKMLATHCACCARPLVDAESVEVGVGPDCRKKHGFARAQVPAQWEAFAKAVFPLELGAVRDDLATIACEGVAGDEDASRRACNKLVYVIAQHASAAPGVSLSQRSTGSTMLVAACVNAIHLLGYVKLAARIEKRIAQVTIRLDGDELVVKTPYSQEGVAAFRTIPHGARRFDFDARAWRVKVEAKRFLLDALSRAYAGMTAFGPKGPFVIGA